MIREFEHQVHGKVRTALIEDDPCFNLKDLCRMYDIKSVNDIRPKLNETGIKILSVTNEKGKQNMLFITADNLTNLFFQSTKAEAEVISDWLYRSVLPQLISYGAYHVDELQDVNKLIAFLDDYQDTKAKANVLETTLKLNTPKIKMIDQLLGSSSCVDLEILHEVIKYKGFQRAELLKVLRATHVLNDENLPLQEFCDKRHFRVVEAKVVAGGTVTTSVRTYVYQSGVAFIENILKEYGGTKDGKK